MGDYKANNSINLVLILQLYQQTAKNLEKSASTSGQITRELKTIVEKKQRKYVSKPCIMSEENPINHFRELMCQKAG